jgi:SNF2 family DNA or RNA helicase
MSIQVEKKGRRIEIRSPAPLPGLKTTVPGAYQTTAGYWTVPLSIESWKLLKQKYGKQLKAGNELRRWVKGVISNRSYMAHLAKSETAKLEVLPQVAPKLYRAMRKRKYQAVGVRYIADNSATLVADDPGLGKTLIAMGGILEAQIPGPYLVVAPKTASDTVWKREITRWLPSHHRVVTMPEFRYERERKIRLTRYTENTWLIIHPEIALVAAWWECQEKIQKKNKRTGEVKWLPCMKKTTPTSRQQTQLKCGHHKTRKTKFITRPSYSKLFEVEWGVIIVDESHEVLIKRNGVPTQRRRGLDMLRTQALRGDGVPIALSGTPFDSKPHQLWGTLNWLDPVTYSAFHRWAELYWQKGGYTGHQLGEFRKDREKMLWDSLKAVALRRTKAEVAKDLPPKIYVGTPLEPSNQDSPIGIWLPMEGKQAKAYEDMRDLSVADLESGRLEAITALAELTRLKQLACCYGHLEERIIKVSCYKDPVRRLIPCQGCTAVGFHREAKQFYVPELPSNKFNWIVESLEEWGYPKDPIDKVVIVSFYTGILNMIGRGINEHFSTRKRPAEICTAITGLTRSNDRRGIIDAFNAPGGPGVMLLNVKAGGTAITIDSADRMIFISETRSPDQQKQAEDRIHRISNPRHCMYYYLRSLGTVDEGTAIVNQEAAMDTHRLLDGRRGVDYFRQILDLSR